MSQPSVLAPWYVVQLLANTDELVYYQSQYSQDVDKDGKVRDFSPDKTGTLIFTTLNSASRIAKANGAHVRVLTSNEEAKEFDRG